MWRWVRSWFLSLLSHQEGYSPIPIFIKCCTQFREFIDTKLGTHGLNNLRGPFKNSSFCVSEHSQRPEFKFTSRLTSLHVAKSLQSRPTLWDPVDCSLPGCSVRGILQARILEWVAMSSSRRSFRPGDWTRISCGSCIGRQVSSQVPRPPGKVTVFISLHFSWPAWEMTGGKGDTVNLLGLWEEHLCEGALSTVDGFTNHFCNCFALRGAAELKIRILYGIDGILESCKQIRFLKIQSLQHLVMAPFRGTQQWIVDGGRRSAAKQIVPPY